MKVMFFIMKRLLIYLCSLLCIVTVSAQSQNIGVMLEKIAAEKDENARIDLMRTAFFKTSEANPLQSLTDQKTILLFAEKNNDKVAEALATAFIGYIYRGLGNNEKSMEYVLKARTMAQANGSIRLLILVDNIVGSCYRDIANYPKAIEYLQESIRLSDRLNYDKDKIWAFRNLSSVYIAMNKIDSALVYSQKDFALASSAKFYDIIGYTYLDMGIIQGKMGNRPLALSYYDMAIQEGLKSNSLRQLSGAYASKAQYFDDINCVDSAIATAKKAIEAIQNTAFSNYQLKPAKLLLDIYRNQNVDSAFKYAEIYRVTNDSLFNIKIVQQTQLMTFETELRKQRLDNEKLEIEKEHKQAIQYVLISIGIIVLVSSYLLISHSFIANIKIIEYVGIIALLIVFEFFNLVMHPFVERVTHHSPIIMLIALVAIAAILVPLHHYLEKLVIHKLIKKNRVLRLAAAKKRLHARNTRKTKTVL
jgi:tetratricopeptide (TPR) repeat protein